jgi:GNAT superfamily N-acetyltransferase
MHAMRIRVAKSEEDVALVESLMREYIEFLRNHPTGSAHFCIGGIDAELANLKEKYRAPGVLLLGEVDGQAAGCVAVREMKVSGPMAAVHAAEGGGLALELKRLWVRPEARGVGLGARLMEAALRHCREADAVAAYLDTVPAAMPGAVRMYEAMGFKAVERYNDNHLNGVAYFCLRAGSERDTESGEVRER